MARILVADDAPAVLDVLHDALTLAGHDVIRATSGGDALRQFKDTRPQLAVIDVMMPDMDGLLVLDGIREIDGQIPVILITGVAGEGLSKKIEHYRAVAFFEKGAGLDRFVELVNKTLGIPGRAGP